MLQTSILPHLLEKFEKSKHLHQPNSSNRRVTLIKEKGELKGYQWENIDSLQLFEAEAKLLESKNLITIEWESSNKVIKLVSLNLNEVSKSYQLVGTLPPWEEAEKIANILENTLKTLKNPWINQWKTDKIEQINSSWKLPSYSKKGVEYWENLLKTLLYYDNLKDEPITLRSFSIACFHNSKTFEKEYLSDFLKINKEAQPDFAAILEASPHTEKESLALLGIYPRNELYELAGKIEINTAENTLNLTTVYPHSLGMSSGVTEKITEINLKQVETIIFLENKTNYEAYLTTLPENTLAIYHGGFSSPAKVKFFQKIAQSLDSTQKTYFWADIDLGGFFMFQKLKQLFPQLIPFNMDVNAVEKYKAFGLKRENAYFKKLEKLLQQEEYTEFHSVIQRLLEEKITIEQEVFLLEIEASSK